jgi:hypothetical protein
VVHGAVPFELGSDLLVNDRLVSHQPRLAVRVANDRRSQRLSRHVGHVTRTSAALALDQGEHGHLLRRRAERFVAGLAADVALVGLDNLMVAAERTGSLRRLNHDRSLAETMKQEPRGLVAGADHPVQLMRRHAGLAGGHQASGQNPLGERDMRAFHNGADRDGKRLAAVLALVDAGARALAGQLGDAVAHHAATRAMRTVRPENAFEVGARGLVVVEDRVGEVELGHRLSP